MENIIVDRQTDWGGNFKLPIQSKTVNVFSFIYIISCLDKESHIGFELQIPRKISKLGKDVVLNRQGIE